MRQFYIIFIFIIIFAEPLFSQPVPNVEENIPFLMTFGNKAEKSLGDDDFSSTFFFLLPKGFRDSVYIRVYDPDIGGDVDEINGAWNSKTTYTVYGGKACWSDKDARGNEPVGNFKSGTMLATETFGEDQNYDKNYYTFGPFNPSEGEYNERWDGNVFKVICEGISGDDGNMYRYFLSTDPNADKPVEGANAFTYEYSFRMYNEVEEVSHIYYYVDDRTISVKLSNFDWDNDGFIRTVSVARKGQLSGVSAEDVWATSEFKILDAEKNTSLDIQFIKKYPPVKNNNVVIYVTNQNGELLEFFTNPIGGIPNYNRYIMSRPIDLQN